MELLVPHSLAEVEDMVASALAARTPLSVLGQGSKAGLGQAVAQPVGLSTRAMTGITLYEPEELVLSCGAGTPLSEIEATLAERSQQLSFEPPDASAWYGGEPGRSTMGGVFATNLAGPRRFKAGAPRDHLLGVQCVTGRGEAIKTGGRVVKNVTGYDLCKLLAGSFGTLAVMGHLTFKVLPASERTATLAIFGEDLHDLAARLRAASGTAYEISGATLLPPAAARRTGIDALASAGGAVALLRLEGVAPSVEDRMAGLIRQVVGDSAPHRVIEEESLALWRAIRDLAVLPDRPVLWRLSLAPTAGPDAARALMALGADLFLDQVGGQVWAALDEAQAGLVRALTDLGGHATLMRAPDADRREVAVFQPQQPPLAALARRVKQSFDPEGILEPGRMTLAA
ncbi:FAD-binding protein [Geminicoccus roseus]|uniref:FAD-binding protein n=1 Tax=Geminicoccus roseus TaxID=404900 RepID=UPI000401B54A|nr:FAD-binding protein [Geminicoccus roseus]